MGSRKRHHDADVEWTAERWYKELFCKLGLGSEAGAQYAGAFANHGLRWETLQFLESEHFREMGITKIGHVIEIMNQIKRICQETSRSRQFKPPSGGEKSSPPKRSKNEPRSEVSRPEPREVRPDPAEGKESRKETLVSPRDELPNLSGGSSSSPIEIVEDSIPVQCRLTVNGNGIQRKQQVEVSSSTERPQVPTFTKIKYPKISGAESVFSRLGGREGDQPIKISLVQSPNAANSAPAGTTSVLRGTKSGGPITVRPHVSRSHLLDQPSRPKPPQVTLENPLVTRVGPAPPPVLTPSRSRSPKKRRDYMYGSMTADQVEMEQESTDENRVKQRLGFRSRVSKKRVTFNSSGVTVREINRLDNTRPPPKFTMRSAVQYSSGRLSVPVVDDDAFYT